MDEFCKVCEFVKPNDDGTYQCMTCRRKFVPLVQAFSAADLRAAYEMKPDMDNSVLDEVFRLVREQIWAAKEKRLKENEPD